MKEKMIKLTAGCMLHDIGKVLFRHSDGRNHSSSGSDFLKENGVEDREILDQVRYHHGKELRSAELAKDSLAYIAYWADNVAAGSDRKAKEEVAQGGKQFDKYVPLASIFNLLNNGQDKMTYDLDILDTEGGINMPGESKANADRAVYGKIVDNLRDGLKAIEFSETYLNSLLSVLEANLTFVPSSTDMSQVNDISLYDHMKITAAVGGCVYHYLEQEGVSDYKARLFDRATESYEEKAFLMYGFDISGIQSYLYQVASDDVLKLLRAKSFYLEILLQNIVDDLLQRMGLSRANLIYLGGGHAYLLLPNTKTAQEEIAAFEHELKAWVLNRFGVDLFVASGHVACSANALMNQPAEKQAYASVFKELAEKLSENKLHRYTADDIRRLNESIPEQSVRECKVCGTTDHLTGKEEAVCHLCASLISASSDIMNQPFVAIVAEESGQEGIMLPFGRHMILESEEALRERIREDNGYIRSYSKNRMFTGLNMTTRIWVGDYHHGNSFHDLAQAAQGVKKLGVLRADVDNLGKSIVHGFDRDGGKSYASLTRNACLSRKLSVFFKLHINHILRNGEYRLEGVDGEKQKRSAVIVYSGGDDMFIVGAWNELLEAAIDVRRKFREFTQGTLTISAGFSLFPEKYPAGAMAQETGALEAYSKELADKNAITLFDDQRYCWEEFEERVIEEKFRLLRQYFTAVDGLGMSALYHLMNYIRNRGDKINIARYAYLLGRMAPAEKCNEETEALYQKFSREMYRWIRSEKESRELLTAIYLYVYLHREDKDRDRQAMQQKDNVKGE